MGLKGVAMQIIIEQQIHMTTYIRDTERNVLGIVNSYQPHHHEASIRLNDGNYENVGGFKTLYEAQEAVMKRVLS